MSHTAAHPESRFWLMAFAAFAGLLWLLSSTLLPFVAGFVLAYFLDPVVTLLNKRGLPRGLGAIVVLASFLALFVTAGLLVAPLLQKQIGALIEAIPSLIETAHNKLLPLIEHWMELLSPEDLDQLRNAAGSYAGSAVGWAGTLAKGLLSRSFALIDILTLIVITPVVAFYLLRDWLKVKQSVDVLLPRRHRPEIRDQFRKIDRALSGFLRGQALVCLSLGLIYSIGLTLVGLKYGATIGLIAGVLSFMPYVGSTFCLVTSMILAFLQFPDSLHLGLTFLVFLTGQSLEGYVLTPKLVGDRVGLHPVWILFALFTGGGLLGFTGVLIAVPVAAAMGVLIRFGLNRYRSSALYQNR